MICTAINDYCICETTLKYSASTVINNHRDNNFI